MTDEKKKTEDVSGDVTPEMLENLSNNKGDD